MSRPIAESIEDGQFDDAPEDTVETPNAASQVVNLREEHNYIDDENILEWSEDSSDEEEDTFDLEEDQMEAEAFESLRAEDEDWEIAERDFTKQYNRLRQHVAVRTGAAEGVRSAVSNNASVAALPAVNRPKPTKVSAPKEDTSSSTHSKDKTENQLQALSKYSSRLRNLEIPYDLGVGVNRKGPSATANQKDKSDRATSEQVLDPRTRIILFKMIGRGLLFEVNGCVSTGKEANVYHALTPEHRHLALKIYKTSILVFKDRDRYVSGEYRFRKGYSRHNPRKMVRVWAEKEMRNLKRLQTAGIRCPDPIEVRENVLVMGFIGDQEGWASPRLKDADIPTSAHTELYVELVLMVRKMFHECKLVHADLSEYNILYHLAHPTPTPSDSQPSHSQSADPAEHEQNAEHKEQRGHLYIIDVSQSVEHDHPHAFDFLRADVRNIEDFFSKRGVHTLGLRRTFEFITAPILSGGTDGEAPLDEETILKKRVEEAEHTPEEDTQEDGQQSSSNGTKVDDEVFMKAYIPRTLNEVYDPERDVGALARGEGEKLIYKDTIGIVAPKEKDETVDRKVRFDGNEDGDHDGSEDDQQSGDESGEDDGGSDEEGDDSDGEGEEGEEGFVERKRRGHRHEDKEAKKERKKAVKAEAREKRKHKIPKAEKKRKVKATARGK